MKSVIIDKSSDNNFYCYDLGNILIIFIYRIVILQILKIVSMDRRTLYLQGINIFIIVKDSVNINHLLKGSVKSILRYFSF